MFQKCLSMCIEHKKTITQIYLLGTTCCCPYVSRDRIQYYYLREFERCERSACCQGKAVRFIKISLSIDLKYSIATFGSGLRSAVEEKEKKRDWSQATIKP